MPVANLEFIVRVWSNRNFLKTIVVNKSILV